VKDLPEDVETSALIGSLADGWGFDVETIDYAAVGFGSYHWVATDSRGERAASSRSTTSNRNPGSATPGSWRLTA
jgi:hypothetical protein